MAETHATVLVVDDNLIMRRLVRATLQPEGYGVIEAESGQAALAALDRAAVDLIIQDLALPDVDGLALVHSLRERLASRPVPILALSGFETRLQQARFVQGGFDDFLFKPVQPAILAGVVRQHLAALVEARRPAGGGRAILADDNIVQRRLLEIQLRQNGFEVALAENGMEALELARLHPPDIIVSDVLMPVLDGFKLSLAIRSDARTAHVPVLLVSSAYVDEADRALALRAGACDLVIRTPEAAPLVEAARRSITLGPPPLTAGEEVPLEQYVQRTVRQLERQAALNARLADRVSMLEAQVAVLAELCNAMQEHSEPETVRQQVLARGLNAFGRSRGAAVLVERSGRPRLELTIGYGREEAARVERCLRKTVYGRLWTLAEPAAVPGGALPEAAARGLLRALGARALLLIPLTAHNETLGLLLVPSDSEPGPDWDAFSRTVGASVGQALQLATSLQDLARTEQHYRTIVNAANDAITVSDEDGRLTFVNPRYEEMFGYTAAEALGRPFWFPLTDASRRRAKTDYQTVLAGASGRFEAEARHKDGSVIRFVASAAPLADAQGRRHAVAMLTDITARKQAEDSLRALSRDLEQRVQERTRELLLATRAAQAERATISAVMSNMSDGLVVIAQRGEVQYCNARAASLLGLDVEELSGLPAARLAERLAEQLGGEGGLPPSWQAGLEQPDGAEPIELRLKEPPRDVQLQFFAAHAPDSPPMTGLMVRDMTAERDLARTKDELVSVVSHELRSPLASVVGFAELLLETPRSDEEQRLYLSTIREEGQRLTALINDFLDLERMNTGRQRFERDAVDVRQAIDRAVLSAGPDKRHPTAVDVPEDLPRVWADQDGLQQVLSNLLGNARKYSPRGGRVTVRARVKDNEVVVAVADRGLGLPPEAMHQLFSSFYRVDSPDRRSISGTGLGLAICRKIVETHGGRIWAESRGLGRGSRFTFTLPVWEPSE